MCTTDRMWITRVLVLLVHLVLAVSGSGNVTGHGRYNKRVSACRGWPFVGGRYGEVVMNPSLIESGYLSTENPGRNKTYRVPLNTNVIVEELMPLDDVNRELMITARSFKISARTANLGLTDLLVS